ncbi:MAG: MFS transporter [Burkholderiales bacterium]|nr:MFS transporter [Burkholderiales bacterium]
MSGHPESTSLWRTLRPALAILVGASVMLSLSMGLRQSLGIFMPPLTRDIGVTVSQFTLAVAVQNLMWGVLQPIAGALAVRIGFRAIMCTGAALYVAALVVLATAQGMLGVMLGAGVMVGAALACTASALAMAAAIRAVSPAVRSTVLGIVSAAGSVGAMIAAPLGQALTASIGWRVGVWGFVALAVIMLPAAWVASRADKIPLPSAATAVDQGSATQALATAVRTLPFVVMALAFFVCGMQLVFITTHLPSYLDLCGMDPMLSAQALGMIGGFNVLGSLFFGWAGGRWNKLVLLGGIYFVRSLVLAAYFMYPPTVTSTLVFAGVMGFLWLGVAPLVAGSVAEMFGVRWQPMIQGLAFFSHQLGSFAGAFGGGMLYDQLGSYELAWRLGVGIGLTAGVVQIAVAFARPPSAGKLATA